MIEKTNIKFDKKIGEGAFGVVYRVIALGKSYALKIEKRKGNLENELRVLSLLNHPSIPQIIAKGEFRGYKFIVMPFFKLSLVQILLYNKNYFTPKTIAAIAWNTVDILEYIHSMNMIYRDLKPENIMIGTNNRIYLVDFGMCAFSFEAIKGQIRGTLRYASINTHKGDVVRFDDDLESLCYLLVFLLTGSLPWFKESKNEKILSMKMNVNYQKLGLGKKWENLVIGIINRSLGCKAIKERLSEIINLNGPCEKWNSRSIFCCL